MAGGSSGVSREVFEGSEFDWFAVDGHGCVGHFSSTGFGPVPVAILARVDELRDLYSRVLGSPIVGDATGHMPGLIDDWLEMARRGLFSYDWQHWSGPYHWAATPSVLVRVDDLPAQLRKAVCVVEWPDVRFASLPSIRPEELCPCD